MSIPILVCNIAWMEKYQGPAKMSGGGSYVAEHNFGHEAYNFKIENDWLHGYVQPSGNGIRIERLGAELVDEHIQPVTVVWVAKRPSGGVYVVGWYKNAEVFRHWNKANKGAQRRVPGKRQNCGYYIRARAKESKLLTVDERTLKVPRRKGGMGQSNVWYPDPKKVGTFLRDLAVLIRKGTSPTSTRRSVNRNGRAWQPDLEKRRAVEDAAMTAVATHYERIGYTVTYIHKENRGWDLEAAHAHTNECLKLEVKGLSGASSMADLTPNEWTQMQRYKLKGYRLCIVTHAITAPDIRLFHYSTEMATWVDQSGAQLKIDKIESARCSASDKVNSQRSK